MNTTLKLEGKGLFDDVIIQFSLDNVINRKNLLDDVVIVYTFDFPQNLTITP